MAGPFEYLSPREFQRLSTLKKTRYLAALFDHLHGPNRALKDAYSARASRHEALARSKAEQPKTG
jgi:hypothetical protein